MSDLSGIDRPAPGGNARMGWTGDLAAGLLRRLGIKYVAQHPGSSFGAPHDSMVNYPGSEAPTMLLRLNGNQAIGLAKRWSSR